MSVSVSTGKNRSPVLRAGRPRSRVSPTPGSCQGGAGKYCSAIKREKAEEEEEEEDTEHCIVTENPKNTRRTRW